jgi:hypothetical protein
MNSLGSHGFLIELWPCVLRDEHEKQLAPWDMGKL